MIVSRGNFDDVLSRLMGEPALACDTEGTGLRLYKGDRLFSIILATATDEFYFNFAPYEDRWSEWLLKEHKQKLAQLFALKPFEQVNDQWLPVPRRWYFHNAKYDLHALAQEGIEVEGEIFCTQAIGRLVRNDLFQYSLDALGQRWLNTAKSTAIDDYCAERGLVRKEKEVGKKNSRKSNLFVQVPLDIIARYGCADGRLTWQLAKFEEAALDSIDATKPEGFPGLWTVAKNEMRLTKTLYRMERTGVKIDRDYCEKALAGERAKYMRAAETFKEIAGFPFEDGSTCLKKAWTQLGLPLLHAERVKKKINPRTKRWERTVETSAEPSFSKDVIKSIDHPIVKAVLDYRQSYKKATTYYMNFLGMCDQNGMIHADFKQGGAKTGRMSATQPNLQNLSKESPEDDDLELSVEEKNFIRRAFIPLSEDYCWFLPDYSQMEYRLMLDYCGRLRRDGTDLIDKILAGVDIHQATADVLGVSRTEAKTINFMLIYGGGVKKLASKLGCTVDEARGKFDNYFEQLPHVSNFVKAVREKASSTGYLRNWFGRRYTFADPDATYTTAPNWLIQGGCADVVKIAKNRCDDLLIAKKARSKLLLSIHDELGFCLHKNELELAPQLQKIMESVYDYKHVPLVCTPEFSWVSLADKIEGMPTIIAA